MSLHQGLELPGVLREPGISLQIAIIDRQRILTEIKFGHVSPGPAGCGRSDPHQFLVVRPLP